MSVIQFPVGPIVDPSNGRLSLEWFMFLQSLNNGVAFAIDQAQAAARFSSGMLGPDSEGDTETSVAMIPGPQGAAGTKGLFVPGLDGQDGEDLAAMHPPGIGGNNADMNTGQVKQYIDFISQATNPPAPPAGTVRFHALTTQGFTRFEQDNEAPTNITLGRDNVFIAKNTTGSSMPAMTPVYRTGATGNVPNIGLAKADSITTLPAIGLTLDTIGAGNFGQVMKLGIMQNVNTNAFGATDELWVSETTAGTLTNVRPVYPNLVQRMAGVLVKGVGNGSLEVVTAPFIGGLESGTTATAYAFAGTAQAATGMAVGGATPGTGGLAFPATAVAVADVNTLDDYEEGTWTPADASGAGLSLSGASGEYEKVGRMVFATCHFIFPATADGSNAKIGTLPFTAANVNPNRGGGTISYTDEATLFRVSINPGTTNFSLYDAAGGNVTNATMSGNQCDFGFMYRI